MRRFFVRWPFLASARLEVKSIIEVSGNPPSFGADLTSVHVLDLNGKQAAIRAGYSKRTAAAAAAHVNFC